MLLESAGELRAKTIKRQEGKMGEKMVGVEVNVPIRIEKTEHGYTAACESLDIYTEGDTKQLAEKNIREAISLFLETCIEMTNSKKENADVR